jgi:acyl carrier protein
MKQERWLTPLAIGGLMWSAGCGKVEAPKAAPPPPPAVVPDNRQSAVQDKVIGIVSKILKKAKNRVRLESRFREDLGCDSLDEAEIVMELEDEFGLKISDDDEATVKTVGQAAALVERLVKQKR